MKRYHCMQLWNFGRSRIKCFLTCIIFSINVTNFSMAKVIVQLDYEYFTVKSNANESFTATLNRVSPIRISGKVFHGYTKWNLTWHYSLQIINNELCTIGNINIKLVTTISLPKFTHVNKKQKQKVDAALNVLKTHEMVHYKHAKQAAFEIDKLLQRIPKMRTCKLLEKRVNYLGSQVIEKYKAKDLHYDLITQHGLKQKAWHD